MMLCRCLRGGGGGRCVHLWWTVYLFFLVVWLGGGCSFDRDENLTHI